ncbi:MAG TPA: hypothetical protein VFR41_13500, partial [Acidimicrobiia bacterium]|nr:hypothetical protein [Acidimicrobiia bacterium]
VTRLSAVERARLREGLTRLHDAPDSWRFAALQSLVSESRRGLHFPTPSAHDEVTCPFHKLERHPNEAVTRVLERIANRNPLHVGVALCHVSEDWRTTTWSRLSPDSRAKVVTVLSDVPGVTNAETREIARDLNVRLAQSLKTLARSNR